METLSGIHFTLGGLATALAVIGGLWWRLKQYHAARDADTKWRADKDHSDANTQKAIGDMQARQAALERDWRGLFERQVRLEAKQEVMKG